MKRIVLGAFVVALLMTSVIHAEAQIAIKIGAKGGANVSDFYGADADEAVFAKGFGFGAFLWADVGESFALMGEGLWQRKGAKSDNTDVGEVRAKLDYIEFPLVAVGTVSVGDFSRLFGFAGPFVSVLMSAKNNETDVKDEFKSTDYGATVGGGGIFDMGTFDFIADARWTFGFVSIDNSKDPDTGAARNLNIKTSNFSFFVGMAFSLGG